jgi:hypothetical protein
MPIGSSRALRSMLIHSCTLLKASRPAAAQSAYGHSTIDFSSGTTSTTGVRCRLEPMSLEERTTAQLQGSVVGDYNLYIAWESVPTDFLAQQSALVYRVTNVVDSRTGRTIDAGPFDISPAQDEAGESHHLKVVVKRVK